MPSDWTAVDTLIRNLGEVRAASYATRASDRARAAIEQAIAEATDAVIGTLDAPENPDALARAHDSIEVVADVIAALDDEVVRTLLIRARGVELRVRARELLRQASAK